MIAYIAYVAGDKSFLVPFEPGFLQGKDIRVELALFDEECDFFLFPHQTVAVKGGDV
jgi:hypothetical protein